MKVIFDPFYPYDESIFEEEGAKKIIGGTWIPILHAMLKNEGIEMINSDRYLAEKKFSSDDLLLCDGISKNYNSLEHTGAKKFLLFSGESPNVDWRLYTFIKRISHQFSNTILFSGVRPYISEASNFFEYFWPNDSKLAKSRDLVDPEKRINKLVMIASNKKQHSQPGNKKVLKWLKLGIMKFVTNFVPSVKLQDLYSFRMKAILKLSHSSHFRLYGKNWDQLSNLNKAERRAVTLLKPEAIEDKFKTLQQFQFALCFENCIYPGYITEKIFDCFIAKTIPIYMGAPDIDSFIPKDLFINMRDFSDFESMIFFIDNLSLQSRLGYIERIENYLQSNAFQKFTDVAFAERIFNLICMEAQKKHNTLNCHVN